MADLKWPQKQEPPQPTACRDRSSVPLDDKEQSAEREWVWKQISPRALACRARRQMSAVVAVRLVAIRYTVIKIK